MSHNIAQHLQSAAAQLTAITETPGLEARMLLAHVLDKPESWLLAWPEKQLSENQQHHFQTLLQERLQGRPIAHILQRRAFWTLDLKVTPDTLIPRPDTEILVETVLQQFDSQSRIRVLDLGTGTGAIALALASEKPAWEMHATDLSPQALEVARHNALAHQLDVRFHNGNWFEALPNKLQFDLIVSNPPYICENDPHLQQGDVRFEPSLALTSGADGLDAIRYLVSASRGHLRSGGMLILEHGYDQGRAVRTLFESAGFIKIMTRHDHARHERVTFGYTPNDASRLQAV